MRCNSCNREWSPFQSNSQSLQCPYCGASQKSAINTSITLNEAVKIIMDKYGEEILFNQSKFLSLLSDIAPKLDEEKQIFAIALTKDVARYFVDNNLSKTDRIDLIYSKLCPVLSEKAIGSFIESIAYALGWKDEVSNRHNHASSTKGNTNYRTVIKNDLGSSIDNNFTSNQNSTLPIRKNKTIATIAVKVLPTLLIFALIVGVSLITIKAKEQQTLSENHSNNNNVYYSTNPDSSTNSSIVIEDSEESVKDQEKTVVSEDSLTIFNESNTDSFTEPQAINSNIVNGGLVTSDGEYTFFSQTNLIRRDNVTLEETNILSERVYYLNCYGENLYFTLASNDKIYSMDKNGKALFCIFDFAAHELTLYKDKLYFCAEVESGIYKICRIDLDGSNLEYLSTGNEWYLTIVNDTIYYTDFNSNRELVSMNLDGTNKQVLINDRCYDLCVFDDYLFYTKGDSRYIYRMSLTDYNEQLILDSYAQYLNCDSYSLFFVGSNKCIYECSSKGAGSSLVFSEDSCSFLNIVDNSLYYYNSSNGSLNYIY